MRILQIRFKNLNSLNGEWEIDFNHHAFVSDGIFAITGATGAGKTTILDAICLALHGRTPRLSRINKSSNEIMSRQTGECFAEVVFETQMGRYRCHWSQRRARKKSGGELQAPRHEIADADSGKVLETKTLEVAKQVESLTGMDFDRFTRSILLAQGGFSAFLQADSDDRAPILEQITGTEIYSQISAKVHERQRSEHEKLNLLKAEIVGIKFLSSEQEEAVYRELDEKQKQETEIATKLQETDKALAWLKQIHELQTEINTLSEMHEKLIAERAAFDPERARLIRAQKAAEIDGRYATLVAVRNQQTEDQLSLHNAESRLLQTASSVQQAETALKNAEQRIVEAKDVQKKAMPLIQKIRALDDRLMDKKRTLENETAHCNKTAEQIAGDKRLQRQHRQRLEAMRKDLQQNQDYLQGHAQDGMLVSELTGIEERINGLISVQQDIVRKKESRTKAMEQLASAKNVLASRAGLLAVHKQEIQAIQKQISRQQKDLEIMLNNRLLREYRAEKDTLLREMALLNKIADLESERARLEVGKPCPLCGSTEHPFAAGHVPLMNEAEKKITLLTERIEKAEHLETEIQALEKVEKQKLKDMTLSEKLVAEATNEHSNSEKNLRDIEAVHEISNADFVRLKQSLLVRLKPYDVREIPDTETAAILQLLIKRMNDWRGMQEKKEEAEKRIAELSHELEKLGAVLDTREKTFLEKQTVLNTHKKDFEKQSLEREYLFGAKNPDAEEARLGKAVYEAEGIEKAARNEWDNARQLHHAITVNISTLKTRIAKRINELQTLEASFLEALHAAGFADEQQFADSRMTLQELEELRSSAKILDDRFTAIQTRMKDRENRLSAETNKKMTESKRQTLELESKALEDMLTHRRGEIARLSYQLTENKKALEKIGKKQDSIEAQGKECSRWEQLHSLIGSADGKKFRNFAQGLTFELMIGHANRQLRKLTDRYLLMRDHERPLELNVVDDYQAGEIRSTKNLSGGESFIVSLALALGLSHMASKNVRVDSLFLDEGFGTLDEEALETALATLAGLHQEGKLIGIISHVPALKERISVQIQVIPQAGGKGRISGPGCREIEFSG
ncbi:MAG: AAA family ATPase [Nitrosomonas sp.]|nr:AAA family ATPase [Nitrosomonas sp.]